MNAKDIHVGQKVLVKGPQDKGDKEGFVRNNIPTGLFMEMMSFSDKIVTVRDLKLADEDICSFSIDEDEGRYRWWSWMVKDPACAARVDEDVFLSCLLL